MRRSDLRGARRYIAPAGAIVLALSGGCGKKAPVAPPPVAVALPAPAPRQPMEAQVTIVASADANPDAGGRPSPIVVRLYLLRNEAAFNGSDFFGLFDADEQALAADLISRDEIVLGPAEQRQLTLPMADATRFVGAVAAYRDIRNAEWRVVLPAWREGTRAVTLSIERARVRATVDETGSETLGER